MAASPPAVIVAGPPPLPRADTSQQPPKTGPSQPEPGGSRTRTGPPPLHPDPPARLQPVVNGAAAPSARPEQRPLPPRPKSTSQGQERQTEGGREGEAASNGSARPPAQPAPPGGARTLLPAAPASKEDGEASRANLARDAGPVQGRDKPIPLKMPAERAAAADASGGRPRPNGSSPPAGVEPSLQLSVLQRPMAGPQAKPSPGDPQPAVGSAQGPKPAGLRPEPAVGPGADGETSDPSATDGATERRASRRRPAGPSRARIAANDDLPSIGGLIYALNQRPSNKPFVVAAAASGVWAAISVVFAWAYLTQQVGAGAGFMATIGQPATLTAIATVLGPIGLFWFLALLVWRAEDLRLRSTAMTEVAVRLAEPDRMAEQSIASLGQAVRRQVSFMNDAVSRALGRAGELEALVHNEVTALERSYEDNERKIRGLIQELAGERDALLNTTGRVNEALRTIGGEVPMLIEKLSQQQLKLANIIESAGSNLTALESALAQQTGNLENALGNRTQHLQAVLEEYTSGLSMALGARTEQLQSMFDGYRRSIDGSIAARTDDLQNVFEEYARALDFTLANRAQALDKQLVERTRALDQAFAERLRLFDESILRSAQAIDGAIGDKTQALTTAMDNHARSLSETLSTQASELDETLMQGISAVRRTSENITRQSIKAIEGLASQSELLKNVSENLLSQINAVTSRFEAQGQSIMRAANALETANYKIDSTLQNRQVELNETLERLTGKAQELDRVMSGASSSIEGSMTAAEERARRLTHELTKGAEARSRSALAEIERMKIAANVEADRAFEELTARFAHVSQQVAAQLGQLQSQFNSTSSDVRAQAQLAAAELSAEHARLRSQIEALPHTARESTEAVRRALQDQMRALEELSAYAAREAARRDVAPPAGAIPGGVLTPVPGNQQSARNLGTLTSTLASELNRQRPPVTLPVPVGAGGGDGRENWSLGDLLARASREEEGSPRPAAQPAPPPRSPAALDFEAMARAIDASAASAVWSRFRAGQRGIMVRSIYTSEGRLLFDEVTRRYRADPFFQRSVDSYLDQFENSLHDTEQRDPTGHRLAQQLVSDMGRVYLFLAHASGRLA
jgi:hypothetical protein